MDDFEKPRRTNRKSRRAAEAAQRRRRTNDAKHILNAHCQKDSTRWAVGAGANMLVSEKLYSRCDARGKA
jgi:hypothetical protein